MFQATPAGAMRTHRGSTLDEGVLTCDDADG